MGRRLSVEDISRWLVRWMAETLSVPRSDIDPREPFASYGLTSTNAVELSGDLEDWLGTRLPPHVAWDYPSIESLAAHLASCEEPVM
jgi:acyl carrier protein